MKNAIGGSKDATFSGFVVLPKEFFNRLLGMERKHSSEVVIMSESHQHLAHLKEQLTSNGIRAIWLRRLQLVLESRVSISGEVEQRSFWVAAAAGLDYIGTWDGRIYRMHDRSRTADLCLRLLSEGTGASRFGGRVDAKHSNELTRLHRNEKVEFYRRLREEQQEFPPEIVPNEWYPILISCGVPIQTVKNDVWRINEVKQARQSEHCTCYLCLFRNHYYLVSPQSRIYGFDDVHVLELCYEIHNTPYLNEGHVSPALVKGYSMHRIEGPLEAEILEFIGHEP